MKKLKELKKKRARLLREAEGFKSADGTFKDDATRTAFDAKMQEIEAVDQQIRALEDEDEETERQTETPAAADATAQATQVERARITGIQDAVRVAKLDPTVATDLVSRGVTIDAARAEIFTKLAAKSAETPTDTKIEVGADARDKWIRGAMSWLYVRSGVAAMVAKHEGTTVDKIDPGEFRGLSLLDLAKESLTRHGVSIRGLDSMAVAGQAMAHRSNFQTTSDFSTLLENTMHKILRAAYGITPDTWTKFCGTASVADFRAHNWYRLGALSQLDTLNEHGEFKSKSIPDAEKATYTATTKGNIIAITRQVIVNDDLGAVVRLTEMLGRAAKLTIEKAAYTLLGQNSNLGPTMSDTYALFDAAHSNIGTGAAISAASIDADRVKMGSQQDPNTQEYTDLRPAVLLLPLSLGGTARVINLSQYDPDTLANKSQMKPNVVAGLYREIVDTPRLSGTRRYSFADPAIAPVFIVSFLNGQQEPVLETQDGWRTDGVEMKARLDFGIDCVDYRGAVTNAGA